MVCSVSLGCLRIGEKEWIRPFRDHCQGFHDTISKRPKAHCGPLKEGTYGEPVVLGALAQALWTRQHPWVFLHFCSKQLEQTSKVTGSICPHPQEARGFLFSCRVPLAGEGQDMWFRRPRSALLLPKRTQHLSWKLLCGRFLWFQRNGLSSAFGHQDKSFQGGRAQALSNFNC